MDLQAKSIIIDDVICKWIEVNALHYEFKEQQDFLSLRKFELARASYLSVYELAVNKFNVKDEITKVKYIFEKLFRDSRFTEAAGLPVKWKDNPFKVIEFCVYNAYINLEVIIGAVLNNTYKDDVFAVKGAIHDIDLDIDNFEIKKLKHYAKELTNK